MDRCPSCGRVVPSDAEVCPACGTSLARSVPAGAPPAGQGALQFSHSGSRYLLGFGHEFFGIWDRQAPGVPVERFPRTDEGWRDAWLRYRAIEPTWTDVGMVAPSTLSRASGVGTSSVRAEVLVTTRLAPPWARLAARVTDGLILAAIFTVLVAGGVVKFDLSTTEGIPRTFFVMAVVVGGIYETAFIARGGQTPGKMLFRIKVVRMESGTSPGLSRALTRWVVPAIAALIPLGALVVYGWLLWDRRRQGLHDKAARTLVISSRNNSDTTGSLQSTP